MKRTPFRPRAGKTWKALARVSNKKRREKHEIAKAKKKLRIRSGGVCEISQHVLRLHPDHPATREITKICTYFACDFHHVIPQSQGGPNTVENALDGCRRCHDWIAGNPRLSRELGILK